MATLDELKVMIDAEIAPFRKKMKEVENQVKGTSDQVKNATAKFVNSRAQSVVRLASWLSSLVLQSLVRNYLMLGCIQRRRLLKYQRL